jgi:hypothetical protein
MPKNIIKHLLTADVHQFTALADVVASVRSFFVHADFTCEPTCCDAVKKESDLSVRCSSVYRSSLCLYRIHEIFTQNLINVNGGGVKWLISVRLFPLEGKCGRIWSGGRYSAQFRRASVRRAIVVICGRGQSLLSHISFLLSGISPDLSVVVANRCDATVNRININNKSFLRQYSSYGCLRKPRSRPHPFHLYLRRKPTGANPLVLPAPGESVRTERNMERAILYNYTINV